MMTFKRTILNDIGNPTSDFHGFDADQIVYTFVCFECRAAVSLTIAQFNESLEKKIGPEIARQVKEHFYEAEEGYRNRHRIKSRLTGSPAFTSITCRGCGTDYFVYAGCDETSMGVYKVKVYGVAEAGV